MGDRIVPDRTSQERLHELARHRYGGASNKNYDFENESFVTSPVGTGMFAGTCSPLSDFTIASTVVAPIK